MNLFKYMFVMSLLLMRDSKEYLFAMDARPYNQEQQERCPRCQMQLYQCSICQENICLNLDYRCDDQEKKNNHEKRKTIVILACCGHPFHLECLAEWVRHSQTCPLCRGLIPHRSDIDPSAPKTDQAFTQQSAQPNRPSSNPLSAPPSAPEVGQFFIQQSLQPNGPNSGQAMASTSVHERLSYEYPQPTIVHVSNHLHDRGCCSDCCEFCHLVCCEKGSFLGKVCVGGLGSCCCFCCCVFCDFCCCLGCCNGCCGKWPLYEENR